MFNQIDAETMKAGLPDNAVILDVRTEPEWVEARLTAPHILIPLDQLDADSVARSGLKKEQAVLILCRAGVRARHAALILLTLGFTDVRVIEGGLIACADYGIPLSSG